MAVPLNGIDEAGAEKKSCRVAEDGKLTLPNLPPGRYLIALARGTGPEGQALFTLETAVPAGAPEARVNIAAEPPKCGRVHVETVDAAGAPLAGATSSLYFAHLDGIPAAQVSGDDTGRTELHVVPGTYRLVIAAAGFPTDTRDDVKVSSDAIVELRVALGASARSSERAQSLSSPLENGRKVTVQDSVSLRGLNELLARLGIADVRFAPELERGAGPDRIQVQGPRTAAPEAMLEDAFRSAGISWGFDGQRVLVGSSSAT